MKRWALSLVVLAAAASAALPCDIVPWPHRHGLQPINLVSQKMDVRIRDQVAHVTIDATFHNPNAHEIEGMYFTNVPAGAQINDLTMIVNGKEMKAELLDAKKAREIYNAIVQARRDPAILELVGQQMIKLSIFPIGANSNVQVKISYTQMLEMDGGLVKFQAPFAHNVTNDKPIQEATLNVSIESKTAIKTIYSPTHHVDVAKKDDHHARVNYEAKDYTSRKDLVLYYALSDQDVAVNLLTYREPGEDGYFVLLASPKVQVDASRVLPKDIIFVYDRSGSMSGDKMRQGQEALQQCLSSLNEADRFTVIDFSTEVSSFEARLVEASKDNVLRAKKYVEKLKAAGSTNIDEALQVALSMLEGDPKRVRMIFFLTDGLPTVGEQRMEKILDNVAKKNEAARLCRIFVFGVGLDVNTLFLDKMAEANRGRRSRAR
jgi:Ca-activated chloride channel homolog